MTEEELYLKTILSEIEILKKNKRRGLFKINMKVSDNCIKTLERYFKNHVMEYDAEFKKCKSCSGTWDIIILFKKF